MKILIFSNNPLEYSSSNGRTMLNMLQKFSHKEIYNFFIQGILSNLNVADFYKINEINLIKHPLLGKFVSKINEPILKVPDNYSHKKSLLRRFIRLIAWNNIKLKKQSLKLIKNINPDILIIQCGDNSYLIKLAMYISSKLNIPLISYNSEDYIFRTWDYYKKTNHRSLLFNKLQNNLIKTYDKLYKKGKSFIYLTENLERMYLERYPNHKSYVIYNSSSLNNMSSNVNNGNILYLGNIGVGRSKTLIEVSKIIYSVLNKKLYVYTTCTDKNLLNELEKTSTIVLNKSVPYNMCIKLISNSYALLHVESLESFYLKDTLNAFSTKIADCLSSGKPFLVVAPKTSFVYKYLKKHNCGFVFNDINEMENFLINVKKDTSLLYTKKDKQLTTSLKNHSSIKNSNTFYEIIKATMNKK